MSLSVKLSEQRAREWLQRQFVCVRVCVCVCVRARVIVCVRAHVRMFVCMRMREGMRICEVCLSVCMSIYLPICFSILYCVPATNQLQRGDASVQLYGQRVTVPERKVFIQRSVHAHN